MGIFHWVIEERDEQMWSRYYDPIENFPDKDFLFISIIKEINVLLHICNVIFVC
jgi:hypothetical protein